MKSTECDLKLAAAAANDPAVEQAMKDMVDAQTAFNTQTTNMAYEVLHESRIATPEGFKMPSTFKDPPGRGKNTGKKAEPPKDRNLKETAVKGYEMLKQMRVAMMLTRPTTYLKNITATGGMAASRFFEEGGAIMLSKMSKNPQSFREVYAYGRGMWRGAMDTPQVLMSAGQEALSKGEGSTAFTNALESAGYSSGLAHSKKDLILESQQAFKNGDVDTGFRKFTEVGPKYIFNAMFGSQFALLQTTDVAFKLISHRSKVEQLLTRQALKKNMTGEAIDDYVSTSWEKMSEEIKAGKPVPKEFKDIEAQGTRQAAEDTFTQTPQTPLGKTLSGNFATNWWGAKGLSETMQLLVPFRSIYVNLMRQTFPRRLTPFFSKETMAEMTGKMGPEKQKLAMSRTAGAWTAVAGGAALAQWAKDEDYVSVNAPGNKKAELADLEFAMSGKVANTLQIGDMSYDLDLLPPHVGIPLGMTASIMEAIDEYDYRYVDDDDKMALMGRLVGGFVDGATDGPWVKEYMDFVSRTSQHIQHGDGAGFADYVGHMVFDPAGLPDWIKSVAKNQLDMGEGADNMITTKSFMSQFLMNVGGEVEDKGYRRNMFGRPITRKERFGNNSHVPWYKEDSEAVEILAAINYDKVYEAKSSDKISGQGNGMNGVAKGVDDHDMSPRERDLFDYYAGQSDMTGGTLAEELIMISESVPNLYSPGVPVENGAKKNQLRTIVSNHLALRRQKARLLVQYNPKFGIREKQIEKFYKASIAGGMDRGQAEQIKAQNLEAMNQTRMQLKEYF